MRTDAKEYKVSFWFGDAEDSGETSPDRVVYVLSQTSEKRVIVAEALKEVGSYPRSYQVLVESGQSETYFVMAISNSKKAKEDAWYHNRDGELFVMRYAKDENLYSTCHFLGNTSTVGYIPPQYCTIVSTFQAENLF